MPISSAIVEIESGGGESVLSGLALMPQVSVYGVKDNQIVIVIDGDSMGVVEQNIKRIQSMENVTGVYPVYSSIEDEQ